MPLPDLHHGVRQPPEAGDDLVLQDLVVVVVVRPVVIVSTSTFAGKEYYFLLLTCHEDSLVDVGSSETLARSWKFSSQDPRARSLYEKLRGRDVVSAINRPASHEECLKNGGSNLPIRLNHQIIPTLVPWTLSK